VGPFIARQLAAFALRRDLERAAAGGDTDAADRALRRAAALRFPHWHPFALATLAERLGDPELARDLVRLERARFAPNGDDGWRGGLAASAARAIRRTPAVHAARAVVE
jgi:hypothetical protein